MKRAAADVRVCWRGGWGAVAKREAARLERAIKDLKEWRTGLDETGHWKINELVCCSIQLYPAERVEAIANLNGERFIQKWMRLSPATDGRRLQAIQHLATLPVSVSDDLGMLAGHQ